MFEFNRFEFETTFKNKFQFTLNDYFDSEIEKEITKYRKQLEKEKQIAIDEIIQSMNTESNYDPKFFQERIGISAKFRSRGEVKPPC